MDKRKVIILVVAAVLLIGLIATKQTKWTPGKEEGVPMEQVTQGGSQQGNNQQNGSQQQGAQKQGQENPHQGMDMNPQGKQDNPHQKMKLDVETNEAGFPKEIAGLKLDKFLSGQKAIKSIEKLHGTSIDIADGYVANYGKKDRKIKIWVSESKSEKAAKEQINVMTEKIMKNSDVFAKPSVFQIKGIRFFKTKGMGMNNYYYKKGKKAYWISVKGVKEAPIMGLIFKVL